MLLTLLYEFRLKKQHFPLLSVSKHCAWIGYSSAWMPDGGGSGRYEGMLWGTRSATAVFPFSTALPLTCEFCICFFPHWKVHYTTAETPGQASRREVMMSLITKSSRSLDCQNIALRNGIWKVFPDKALLKTFWLVQGLILVTAKESNYLERESICLGLQRGWEWRGQIEQIIKVTFDTKKNKLIKKYIFKKITETTALSNLTDI